MICKQTISRQSLKCRPMLTRPLFCSPLNSRKSQKSLHCLLFMYDLINLYSHTYIYIVFFMSKSVTLLKYIQVKVSTSPKSIHFSVFSSCTQQWGAILPSKKKSNKPLFVLGIKVSINFEINSFLGTV